MEEERRELGLHRNLDDKELGGTNGGCLLVVNIVFYSTKGMIFSGDRDNAFAWFCLSFKNRMEKSDNSSPKR